MKVMIDVIIKKKSVYKREYYLKKKIILFQEKYDFIFTEDDLKKIEVFYKLNDTKILERLKRKLNKKIVNIFFIF